MKWYNDILYAKPGVMAGDLYVRIRIAKHKVFERRGADLYIEKKIPLVEALTGTSFTLPFLDGTQLNISTSVGQVISPGIHLSIIFRGIAYHQKKGYAIL